MALRFLPVPPAEGQEQAASRLAWFFLAALGAVASLAWARLVLRSLVGNDVTRFNAIARGKSGATPENARSVAIHLSRVVPGMAGLVPWRSDCLVQALAAQRLLGRLGVPSEIVIGVRNAPDEGFSPHAWLRCGDRIVTGGDVKGYDVLLGEDQ